MPVSLSFCSHCFCFIRDLRCKRMNAFTSSILLCCLMFVCAFFFLRESGGGGARKCALVPCDFGERLVLRTGMVYFVENQFLFSLNPKLKEIYSKLLCFFSLNSSVSFDSLHYATEYRTEHLTFNYSTTVPLNRQHHFIV